jgi:hypothetical protein
MTAVAVRPVETKAPTRYRVPLTVFVLVGITLAVVVWTFGSMEPTGEARFRPRAPADAALGGWLWFDGTWYVDIAQHGYFYTPGEQSSVAFFPAYPLTVRTASALFVDEAFSAIFVTASCGLLVALLFWRWSRDRLTPNARITALGLLLVYPYAWFLYGAGYADALFLAATLGAFVLVERDRPISAGLLGAVATAARPVGAAVMIGLAVVSVSRRRAQGQRLRIQDAGVLLSATGLLSWCAYLAVRFGNPFAFASVQAAPGWDQAPGPRTWFKLELFHRLLHDDPSFSVRLAGQAVLALLFLALVPLVVRRLGWGYGAYAAVVIGIPLVGSGDFQGMGRYLLASFPTFAAVGAVLAERPRWMTRAVTATSFVLLVGLTSLFARGYYLT